MEANTLLYQAGVYLAAAPTEVPLLGLFRRLPGYYLETGQNMALFFQVPSCSPVMTVISSHVLCTSSESVVE
jgi:hypothetical protein